MFRPAALIAAAALSLSACAGMDPNERMAVGALAGAAAGIIAADVLRADRNWTMVAALGGAAAGVLVARNAATGQCAYSDGRGRAYTGPCR
jgi:osmotically inducible lipoprotein OsmB